MNFLFANCRIGGGFAKFGSVHMDTKLFAKETVFLRSQNGIGKNTLRVVTIRSAVVFYGFLKGYAFIERILDLFLKKHLLCSAIRDIVACR